MKEQASRNEADVEEKRRRGREENTNEWVGIGKMMFERRRGREENTNEWV